MLRGHNSFLRTGSAVKHKTQTKEERERAEGKESKKRGREGKTDASPEKPSLHLLSTPALLPQLPRHGVRAGKDPKEGLGCCAWLCLFALLLEKATAGLKGWGGGRDPNAAPGCPPHPPNKNKKELWTPGLGHLRVCPHCLLASLHEDRVQDASRGAGQLPAAPPKIWGAFQAQLDTTAPLQRRPRAAHVLLCPHPPPTAGTREAEKRPGCPPPVQRTRGPDSEASKSQEHAETGRLKITVVITPSGIWGA